MKIMCAKQNKQFLNPKEDIFPGDVDRGRLSCRGTTSGASRWPGSGTKGTFLTGLLLSLSMVGLTSCRGESPAVVPVEQPHPAKEQGRVESAAGTLSLRGTLAKTVEEGGWLVRTESGDYLLISASPFQDKDWFREGQRVEVTGREDQKAVTLFMQGVPLHVDSMQPLPREQEGAEGEM